MTDERPLVFGKALNGKGGATELKSLEDIKNCAPPYWVHFDANHPETESWIRAIASEIDEDTLSAMFAPDARPRVLSLEHGHLVILRAINHNEGQNPEDMLAVRFWITANRIVSLRFRKSRAVTHVGTTLDNNNGPKTIGDIFSQVCSTMLSYIEVSISELYDTLDALEERVLDKPDRQLRADISDVRRSAILLRRYIAPQKDAINQLRYEEVPWLSALNLRRIHEAQDLLMRNIEDLDAIRERAQVVKDELVNALSDKLNRNLYLLSVITAIFLPLGFLTGLFGINIGGMPGVDNSHAFTIFSMALTGLILTQVAIFKLLKWF